MIICDCSRINLNFDFDRFNGVGGLCIHKDNCTREKTINCFNNELNFLVTVATVDNRESNAGNTYQENNNADYNSNFFGNIVR